MLGIEPTRGSILMRHPLNRSKPSGHDRCETRAVAKKSKQYVTAPSRSHLRILPPLISETLGFRGPYRSMRRLLDVPYQDLLAAPCACQAHAPVLVRVPFDQVDDKVALVLDAHEILHEWNIRANRIIRQDKRGIIQLGKGIAMNTLRPLPRAS